MSDTPTAPRSIGADYPHQLARCRELLEQYENIGPAGSFGALHIRNTIDYAKKAKSSGDVVMMVRAYALMQEVE